MNICFLMFATLLIGSMLTAILQQIIIDKSKSVVVIIIGLIIPIIIIFIIMVGCSNLEKEAERNYNKDNLTLDLVETINLSNESNIRIERIFSNNPQDILYSINVTDGDNEIFLSVRKNFEVINCTEDFKIEVYNSKYRYKKWIFHTEKNSKYYKIYFNEEKIKEISSTYLE